MFFREAMGILKALAKAGVLLKLARHKNDTELCHYWLQPKYWSGETYYKSYHIKIMSERYFFIADPKSCPKLIDASTPHEKLTN